MKLSTSITYKLIAALMIVMLALVTLPVKPAYAAACNAIATGSWTAIGTWSCGHVPTSADDVTINAARTVSFDAAGTSTVLSLTVNGTLNFNNASGNSITVSGNVTNAGTIAVVNQTGNNTHVLSIGGNFANNGAFTAFSSNDSLNVVLNGTAAQTIGGTTTPTFNNLTISNTAAAVTATSNFNMIGTMTVNNGATFNAGTFVVFDSGNNSQFTLSSGATLGIGSTAGISGGCGSGNIQTNNCTYDPGANYVYNGTANQNAGSGLPNNLTGTVTINNPGFTVTLNNGRTIASGGTVKIVAGTFAAGTNLTMATTSSITRSGGSMTGTPQGNGVYNVTYTGNSMTTSTELAGNGLNNVTVNLNSGQTLTLDQNRVPDGNVSISSGTFDLSTFTINRSAAGGIFTVSNGAALKIGGTNGFPINYNTHTLGTSSTVEYAGTNQNVSAETYGNLIFSGSGLKSMITGTSVGGNLSIAPTGTAKASVGNGLNLTVNSLTLGGLGKISGTWGSTISPATNQDNNYFNNLTTGILTVTTDNRATPSVTTWPTASGITYPQALSASTLTGGSASVAGSFAFTTPATIPPAGAYSASVTFTPTDAKSYKTVTGNVNVAVAKATPTATLAVNNSPVTYDGSPHSATVAISVSSVPGSVANILTGGLATQTDANTYAVTADFVPNDITNYNTLTGLSAGNFVIDKATPVITWANPADIIYGTALSGTQLNAAASVAGTFTYNPASGTVLSAGNGQTLSVDFVPFDSANYSNVTGTTVLINVLKATPVITWANPADIVYGTAL
ncbi:MAG: hypothetical protein HYX49_01420, partial [Chloroflexi bacterium]|nr:hypothetical protein [Chloroflexota bacterium]